LEYLKYYKDQHECIVFQYAIMPSHLHLILMTTGGGTIAQFMHDFCLAYAHNYNIKHGRKGHFWRRSYRNKVIGDDCYALCCLRYQDRNAVAAGIVDQPREWPWCGYRFYAEGEPSEILTPHPSYELLGSNNEERRIAYKAMFEDVEVSASAERMLFESGVREGSRRFDEALRSVTGPMKRYLANVRYTSMKSILTGMKPTNSNGLRSGMPHTSRK
jgi:putative transposase